jgi:hypothetical protein
VTGRDGCRASRAVDGELGLGVPDKGWESSSRSYCDRYTGEAREEIFDLRGKWRSLELSWRSFCAGALVYGGNACSEEDFLDFVRVSGESKYLRIIVVRGRRTAYSRVHVNSPDRRYTEEKTSGTVFPGGALGMPGTPGTLGRAPLGVLYGLKVSRGGTSIVCAWAKRGTACYSG